MQVKIVKNGDQPGQGVGYMDDGTMVVVEYGRQYMNREVELVVTSVLQTSAGRMIFGKMEEGDLSEHSDPRYSGYNQHRSQSSNRDRPRNWDVDERMDKILHRRYVLVQSELDTYLLPLREWFAFGKS